MYTDDINGDWRTQIAPFLPERLAAAVNALPKMLARAATELRFGANRPLLVLECAADVFIRPDGSIAAASSEALKLTNDECARFMDSITKYSAYAYAEEIRNGFLTLAGGYRVGIAGKAVVRDGNIDGFSACSSFCIRIPREFPGIAANLYRRMRTQSGILNTLIVSPPGMGKTTYLRDLARLVSDGAAGHAGLRTSVIDERNEIGGGKASSWFHLGEKTDVLDSCPKSQAIILALRSLNPQVIVTDEIGRPEDSEALLDAINCGVSLVASAHGRSIDDLMHRPVLRQIMQRNFFDLYAVIDGSKGVGVITSIVQDVGTVPHRRTAGGVI